MVTDIFETFAPFVSGMPLVDGFYSVDGRAVIVQISRDDGNDASYDVVDACSRELIKEPFDFLNDALNIRGPINFDFSRVKMPESNPKLLKIETDGTVTGTKTTVGGVQVKGIKEIRVDEIEAGDKDFQLLTLKLIDFEYIRRHQSYYKKGEDSGR